jgi:hypothetical protein
MSPRLLTRLLAFLIPWVALAHQNASETDLLVHFAMGERPIESGRRSDLTGRAVAWVVGKPVLTTRGPAEALVLDGFTDHLLIATNAALAEPLLSRRDMTPTAWVVLEDARINGVVGFVQDEGNFEKGWVLYEKHGVDVAFAGTSKVIRGPCRSCR